MAQEKKQPAKKLDQSDAHQRQVIHTHTDDAKEIYANTFSLEVNAYDFKLLFGLIKRADGDVLEVEDLVNIRMSPQHTKSVLSVLAKNVKTYEEQFGNIVIPPLDDNN